MSVLGLVIVATLAFVRVAAPANAGPIPSSRTGDVEIVVTSMGCTLDDAELQRLLVVELGDLPQADNGFALHVELRCETSEIGILVDTPNGGTSLARNIVAPEAAVGRERVLALAIRQLVDSRFIDLVIGEDQSPPDPMELRHDPEQASEADPRAPSAIRPAIGPHTQPGGEPGEPTDESPSPTADLVAGGGAKAAQGAPAPAADQARVDLGVEVGALGRALEARPLAAARFGLRVDARVARRWSVLGLVATDWTTLGFAGGRVHAIDLSAGFGTRAHFAMGADPFSLRIGGDFELGWGRVWAQAKPGFEAHPIDSVVAQARLVAGVWAEGRRGAIGIELAFGGGPPTPIGTVNSAGEQPGLGDRVSLGGVFVGALIGGSLRVR